VTVDVEKLRELLDKVEECRHRTPVPWMTSAESGDYGRNQPVDHEGCQSWPWANEEEMVLAYALRNEAPALLDRLERLEAVAAAAKDPAMFDIADDKAMYEAHKRMVAALARLEES
jgi:hypothetical protein